MELDRRGAGLLFQVVTETRGVIAIASNELFSGWTKIFTDPRLCAAIVDRLTFAGQIIETGNHELPARAEQEETIRRQLTTGGQKRLVRQRCHGVRRAPAGDR
ncbi:MAG: ATP-binding protein [Streptosporangiaceae bacterium]